MYDTAITPNAAASLHPLGVAPSPPIRFDDAELSRLLPGKIDYKNLASEIARGIQSGARSMIDACVLLHHGMLSCDDENALKDAFLRELASNNVIPKRSSRTGEGFEKSKLSMLRKIGANAGLLLDEHLFKYLEPGRSILFHVVRLYEELQGDHEERVAELVKRFSMQGALSRSFLIGQIKLEEAKKEGENEKSAEPWVPKVKSDGEISDFDVVLLTPSQDALLRLEQYSFDELSRRFWEVFGFPIRGTVSPLRGLLTLAKSRDCFRPSGCLAYPMSCCPICQTTRT